MFHKERNLSLLLWICRCWPSLSWIISLPSLAIFFYSCLEMSP